VLRSLISLDQRLLAGWASSDFARSQFGSAASTARLVIETLLLSLFGLWFAQAGAPPPVFILLFVASPGAPLCATLRPTGSFDFLVRKPPFQFR
jgi:hypothetical protein